VLRVFPEHVGCFRDHRQQVKALEGKGVRKEKGQDPFQGILSVWCRTSSRKERRFFAQKRGLRGTRKRRDATIMGSSSAHEITSPFPCPLTLPRWGEVFAEVIS